MQRTAFGNCCGCGSISKLNTIDEWKNTANALSYSSATTLDDEECSRILSLSYNHLPHNLKACFLYLGVFPEDHEIYADHLARLWFAEGLVKAFENESFDAVANRYIQELMDRNLIILSELSSCGRKIKTFRMHDLLHAFCVREAQNENLLHVVISENSSDFSGKGFRWISIQLVNFNMSTIHSRSKSCRLFFCVLQEELSFNFKIFNLLRVLYPSFELLRFNEIEDIVLLRFLMLICRENIELSRAQGFLKSRCRMNIDLSRAWNLQTLYCNRVSYRSKDGGNYLEFPQLQHIHCSSHGFHGNPPNFVRELSWIRADYCSKKHIMNIPYLKKVCITGKSRDCIDCIRNLAYLKQLEGLQICGDEEIKKSVNNHIVLLKNLRKLSIRNMGFECLSKLPRLEVLKLNFMSCVGEDWEIPEEVIFCQLISLYIKQVYDLKHWRANCHNFPRLECLFLWSCRLREIPIGFAEISTLKSIKICDCLPSAAKSAKNIQDEQRDYGNYNMVVSEEYTKKDYESEESLSKEDSEADD